MLYNCVQVIVNLHKEIDQLKEENRLLRSKLGLQSEGDITSSAVLKTNVEMNPSSGLSLPFTSFFRTAPPAVGEENEAIPPNGMVNSNKCGWMLDKERMLTQLRTAERLLCKKIPSNSSENLQVNCVHLCIYDFCRILLTLGVSK